MSYVTMTKRSAGYVVLASDYNQFIDNDEALRDALLTAWLAATVAWTYATATSFTAPGDLTAYYKPGTLLRWVQTTTKWGVVASSSYAAPNMTVNLIPTSDYVVANAAIASPYLSYSNPPDSPGAFNFSVSSRTGYTVGGGATEVVQWRTCGREMLLFFSLIDVTSSATTFKFGLPVNSAAWTSGAWSGALGYASDNGAALTTASRWQIGASGSEIVFYKDMAGNAWTASSTKSARGVTNYIF